MEPAERQEHAAVLNIVASGDEKAVKMLLESCDPEGRRELRTLQELITFLDKTRGWYPTAYPTSIAEEVFLRSLLNAAIMSKEENSCIPHVCEMQEELERRKKSGTRQRERSSKRGSGAEESPSQANGGEGIHPDHPWATPSFSSTGSTPIMVCTSTGVHE